MGNIWIVTDTHYRHEKIKTFCGRPNDFEDRIINSIMQYVKPGDVLYHLGDFSWDREWPIMPHNSIPCTQILIRGNHDKETDSYYMKCGFAAVTNGVILKVAGKRVRLSHYPVVDESCDMNIHGHFHNNDPARWHMGFDVGKLRKYQYLFKMEHSYQPINLEHFVTKPEKFLRSGQILETLFTYNKTAGLKWTSK